MHETSRVRLRIWRAKVDQPVAFRLFRIVRQRTVGAPKMWFENQLLQMNCQMFSRGINSGATSGKCNVGILDVNCLTSV